jgi:hypothetical protein
MKAEEFYLSRDYVGVFYPDVRQEVFKFAEAYAEQENKELREQLKSADNHFSTACEENNELRDLLEIYFNDNIPMEWSDRLRLKERTEQALKK